MLPLDLALAVLVFITSGIGDTAQPLTQPCMQEHPKQHLLQRDVMCPSGK